MMKIVVEKRMLHILLIPLFLFFINIESPARACTLWGSAGEFSVDSSTIIAKNRDWKPDSLTVVKKAQKKDGYRYFGIFGEENGKSTGLKAGVNETGLSLVSATASSIPKKERKYPGKKFSINTLILSKFDSVDAVLKEREIFSRYKPCFFMIGDKHKIAVIEVAPGGKISVKETENGILYHTNHYFAKTEFEKNNKKKSTSSKIRLKRLSALLDSREKPLSMQDFIKISLDRNDGADNSIWRTGSTPKKSRTLATFIVEIPKTGPTKVFIRTADPGKERTEYRFILDDDFWNRES
ncbi:MAG: C45 family peptidase [Candidatus Eremiobacteraeota bacterium]|nr:C45 family peptidase [Candidatus Eremiobacteraeota bacterium]